MLVPVAVDSPRRYTGAMNAIDERACGKPGCDNFGKPGLNIVGHGWFVTTSGRRRRYRCTVCGGTLSTNTGTAYRGLRCSRREFDQVASLRVEGVSISATARVTGHSRTTIARWLERRETASTRRVPNEDVDILVYQSKAQDAHLTMATTPDTAAKIKKIPASVTGTERIATAEKGTRGGRMSAHGSW